MKHFDKPLPRVLTYLPGGGGGGGGVRLIAPGFGAHRICACPDPVFHFFSSAYFTEGPICLGPLPVSFFLMENYRLVLVLIAL